MITQDMVLSRSRDLPVFPNVMSDIIACIDDPNASVRVLADHLKYEPVVCAKVMAMANIAAIARRRNGTVRDVYTATAMIGLKRVRDVAVVLSFADMIDGMLGHKDAKGYWQYSVAVGICCEELAYHVALPINLDHALMAGMLHNVGQLWLLRFERIAFAAVVQEAMNGRERIESVETRTFGVDHAAIGGWLAEHWKLPAGVVDAVRYHHEPETHDRSLFVPLTHVAEVICNALDLGPQHESSVTRLSAGACTALGLEWNESSRRMFGRIEGRSRFVTSLYNTVPRGH
ncbi:MAG: HDOD domain-containing protein [Rhodocyclaceae bacterium]|nr:HDOD domain-containing protein [Rhodocyclaceae bacterium]